MRRARGGVSDWLLGSFCKIGDVVCWQDELLSRGAIGLVPQEDDGVGLGVFVAEDAEAGGGGVEGLGGLGW